MLTLRAHHLLCLPRFRGRGYSEEFTANMAAVAKSLSENPRQMVRITDGPDDICDFCPHLNNRQCVNARNVKKRDRQVLAFLGLQAGESREYAFLQQRLHALKGAAFQKCCTDCGWLDLCLSFAEA
ncbi:DUF1284 domain-containing protein [Dethiobacter alkaliphilus]|uniref:DUF1284 domain-containing protein n=1 Tax=Dethiobacter alkaliphilus TaxID=427926 RepID=UPI0022262E93|nr:DUF1284 domain-containing protein [Dethiobacter alkaliphilus]MCW3490429.1 DUF1284 domain-containing protein [Dethiobacter alkaliphilus]